MYYLLLIFFYAISLLPFWILYGISDCLYLIIYKILKYRKNVTLENLSKAFPNLSEQELNSIAKKYYHNLCDSILETIKLLTISKQELNKRFIANWEVLDMQKNDNRVVQGYLSHLFNWEWGVVASNWNCNYQFTGLYNKISNKAMNKIMLKIRSRSGGTLVDMNDMQKLMGAYQKQNTMWGIVADQNPSGPERSAWEMFFNRETAFFKGAEIVARRYNNVLFFGQTIKLKRGYYQLILEKKYDDPKTTIDGEITKAYVEYLENCIKQQPENWVWSHRRWKHIRKASKA